MPAQIADLAKCKRAMSEWYEKNLPQVFYMLKQVLCALTTVMMFYSYRLQSYNYSKEYFDIVTVHALFVKSACNIT